MAAPIGTVADTPGTTQVLVNDPDAGQSTITLRIVTSDGFGVDIDRLMLIPVP